MISDEDEDTESEPALDVDYDSLSQIMLDNSHKMHVRKLVRGLKLPFNFISLLEICRIAKVTQLVCTVYNWSAFPFCCLFRTCANPLDQLPFIKCGRQPNERQLPDFPGSHAYVPPEDWIKRLSNGVIDMIDYRFSNFPQAFDFTNVILQEITSVCSCVEDVFFTIHIVKKCGLNNGRFLAVVFLLYTYLLKGKSVENVAEARGYLLRLVERGEVVNALQQCCVVLNTFNSHTMLWAMVVAWQLHGCVQPHNGYRFTSFATESLFCDPWDELKHKGSKSYFYSIQIPRKYVLVMSHMVNFAKLLSQHGVFLVLCRLDLISGPFTAQQELQCLSSNKQLQCVWQEKNEISVLLRNRGVYPGPGVMQLMLDKVDGLTESSAPPRKKRKGNSRLQASSTVAEKQYCKTCFEVLSSNPPLALTRLEEFIGKRLPHNAFEEQFQGCELSCNIARTSRRKKVWHWEEELNPFFDALMCMYRARQRKQYKELESLRE